MFDVNLELMLVLFVLMFIGNIVMVAFWIWGITSMEDAIRDDLKRYNSELTLEQIQKAISFYESMKGKK